jgi:putative SOS response-associated peptidase YedK
MCGRFVQERSNAELAELFDAEALVDDPGGRYNLAPTDPAAIVVQRGQRRGLTDYRWGLVPHWANGLTGGARAINARAETISSSPTFRDSFARHRCLVPADGFYEWRREGGRRRPFLIRRPDRLPLALAGLWAGWPDPESGEVRRTFSIVTTRANPVVAQLHDRMPVALPPASWARWLDPGLQDPEELQVLLEPSADDLELFPVASLVNNVRNNGPALIEPLGVPIAEQLSARLG